MIAACLAALTLTVSAGTPEVSIRTLLDEMADLPRLTRLPDPSYTCRQFSSYDRASKSPEQDWFANADAGHFLRQEPRPDRTEYVMMDAEGPGAIVRIWSANPKGILRVYVDEDPEPVIEVPMADFLSGKVPYNPEPIAHVRSAGWNSYLPIPYAKWCKVTSDEKDFYYHVNYRTYPAGTNVKSFTPVQADELKPLVQDIAKKLNTPKTLAPEDMVRTKPVKLEPGKTELVATLSGPAAVAVLSVENLQAPDADAALRGVLMTMEFDGQPTVVAPLGDFFGTAPGRSPYESLPMGVAENGRMWSHWRMPFRKEATVSLTNHTDKPVSATIGMAAEPYAWDDRSMYFHAKWRIEHDDPTRPFRDWNFVEIDGQGLFVGAAQYVANRVKTWWGEGDEKIYVDGETFPSHFGTGTEDYFGYAWCNPAKFTHAFHNQPRCDGPGNYGHTAVNRWHILDNIPFTKSFRFDMEIWHWTENFAVTVAAMSYWYARPAAKDSLASPAVADLRVPEMPPYVPPKVAGALEGEDFRIIQSTGNVRPQEWGDLSMEKHLWWTDNKAGDKLVLGFPVTEAGRYKISARFLTAGDYGITQLSINEQPAGQLIDLYSDGVKPGEEQILGTFDLKAGENTLIAEIVGKNEKSTNTLFGLDYLLLTRE